MNFNEETWDVFLKQLKEGFFRFSYSYSCLLKKNGI